MGGSVKKTATTDNETPKYSYNLMKEVESKLPYL
jgi:hypothetical protein